jgi:hypothetical protein
LRLYADSPRIFVWSIGPDPTGKSNAVVVQSDLRRDVLRAVANDASSQSAIASHKLLFGALEGALEHELGVPPQPDASTEYVTTSSLADSGGVTLLQPGSPVSANDPETQARLQAVLAAGDTAIVPKRVLSGGMAGWWQVARGTGDVRPVLDDDLEGGFTKGGYPDIKNPLPPPGDSPKGNPLNWNGPQQENFARLEMEFDRETKLLAKGIDVGEFGEDKDSSGQVIVESEPAWLKVAVATGEGTIFALWAYELLKGAL